MTWFRGRRLFIASVFAAAIVVGLILGFDLHDDLTREEYPTRWASNLTWCLRVTVSISAPLFVTAFVARPLNDLLHTRWTRWLLKNRRYFGLSSAAFLLQHLWLLPLMHIEYRIFTIFFQGTTLFPAGLILLLATALALTSVNRAQRSMPGWKVLHWVGVQALWFWYTKVFYGEFKYRGHPYQGMLLSLMLLAQTVRIIAFAKAVIASRRSK